MSDRELARLRARLRRVERPSPIEAIVDRTICQDALEALPLLPAAAVDLVIADPPYNMGKDFNGRRFSRRPATEYEEWLHRWLPMVRRALKSTGTLYVCSEWRSSGAIERALSEYFVIRNRITWEREKGRGAVRNWKNCAEDIWYCTVGEEYTFNGEAVRLCRRVRAPYTDRDGRPKDWKRDGDSAFRMTCASNLWTDLTVPFWSMPENTPHPTQKPEKLVAKIVLASSRENDVVLDPFLGSGTTSVVARKLGRRFVGIERDELYCCLAERRLELALSDESIQGFRGGVFWERNSTPAPRRSSRADVAGDSLF